MRELAISKKKKNRIFAMRTSPCTRSTFLCLKQHAFFGVSHDFVHTPTLMFVDPQKGRLKPRRELDIWLPHRNFDPPDLPKKPIPAE